MTPQCAQSNKTTTWCAARLSFKGAILRRQAHMLTEILRQSTIRHTSEQKHTCHIPQSALGLQKTLNSPRARLCVAIPALTSAQAGLLSNAASNLWNMSEEKLIWAIGHDPIASTHVCAEQCVGLWGVWALFLPAHGGASALSSETTLRSLTRIAKVMLRLRQCTNLTAACADKLEVSGPAHNCRPPRALRETGVRWAAFLPWRRTRVKKCSSTLVLRKSSNFYPGLAETSMAASDGLQRHGHSTVGQHGTRCIISANKYFFLKHVIAVSCRRACASRPRSIISRDLIRPRTSREPLCFPHC